MTVAMESKKKKAQCTAVGEARWRASRDPPASS